MKFDEASALVVCGMQGQVKQAPIDHLSQPEFMTRITDVLSLWRNRGWTVFHLKDLGEPSNFIIETAPTGSEQFFDCESSNGFLKTPMGSMLRMDGCSNLIFCGFKMQSLVYNTALHAQSLGFESHILLEASTAMDDAANAIAIEKVFAHQAVQEGVSILKMSDFFSKL